jgi:hypothetical protein
LLDSLCGLFSCGNHGCGCGCEASCGCSNGCGCGDSCGGNGGCGCGGSNAAPAAAPQAPAAAGASLMPVPPRPVADPNASISRPRNVVRTSFVR